jgi:hypothetical protein
VSFPTRFDRRFAIGRELIPVLLKATAPLASALFPGAELVKVRCAGSPQASVAAALAFMSGFALVRVLLIASNKRRAGERQHKTQ